MSWLGWVANALLCYQWWALGHKYRHGMVVGVIASLMWAGVAVSKDMGDLLFIEVVLAVLQFRAWLLWSGHHERSISTDYPVCSGSDQ